jgi:hypothetical protein
MLNSPEDNAPTVMSVHENLRGSAGWRGEMIFKNLGRKRFHLFFNFSLKIPKKR